MTATFELWRAFDMAIRSASNQGALVQIRSLRGDMPCSGLTATVGVEAQGPQGRTSPAWVGTGTPRARIDIPGVTPLESVWTLGFGGRKAALGLGGLIS
jgi:hypothetical protein